MILTFPDSTLSYGNRPGSIQWRGGGLGDAFARVNGGGDHLLEGGTAVSRGAKHGWGAVAILNRSRVHPRFQWMPAGVHQRMALTSGDMLTGDVFRRPGTLKVLGLPIDFGTMNVDTFAVGGEDDAMMPWRGCFRVCQEFRGNHEFVLSTSGHVQSMLRPPRGANKHYYVNTAITGSPEEWMNGATRKEGSWWEHWDAWLRGKSGELRSAPDTLGSKAHPPLMDAPGRYVLG